MKWTTGGGGGGGGGGGSQSKHPGGVPPEPIVATPVDNDDVGMAENRRKEVER